MVRTAEAALEKADGSPGKMVDNDPASGRPKLKGGIGLLKSLIVSRTGKGPTAKNNEVAADAVEPKEGALLKEARAALLKAPCSKLPPTPRRIDLGEATADDEGGGGGGGGGGGAGGEGGGGEGGGGEGGEPTFVHEADCPGCGMLLDTSVLTPLGEGNYYLRDATGEAFCKACDARVEELDEC